MFLKNNNIIFKIRRSKVTHYAALNVANVLVTKRVSGYPVRHAHTFACNWQEPLYQRKEENDRVKCMINNL